MNLAKPPAANKLLSWFLRNKGAVVDYFKAVQYLSRLTLIVTYQGKRQKVKIEFTGKGTELNVNLDSLL